MFEFKACTDQENSSSLSSTIPYHAVQQARSLDKGCKAPLRT
ncbi:hypothetical protein SynBIOSE41_02920 [Synechococcus sp. BIOS-E4-1]|nr:hypothetical protein SynBIOSE41_02920 [Synechococcus sp. BIOS-E4-1]